MANHHDLTTFIWQIADLLRCPYRPPQYGRVMLPMTVLRRFDCVLAPTKDKVLTEHEKRKDGKLNDDALGKLLNRAAGQRFHNHSPLTFEKLKGDPDRLNQHLTSYIKSFSANVRCIFEFFEFDNEIEKMHEANIRKWIIENDWLEAGVALPEQMFYNTGIGTHIWIVTNRKEKRRRGKIQLFDAREIYMPVRRSLGDKRRKIGNGESSEPGWLQRYIGGWSAVQEVL